MVLMATAIATSTTQQDAVKKAYVAPFSTVSNYAKSVDDFSLLPYLLVYTIPCFVALGMVEGGVWHYSTLVVTFGVIPLLDFIVPHLELNPTPNQAKVLEKQVRYQVATCLWPLAYITCVLGGCYYAATVPMTISEVIGLFLGVGICSGLAINVAHELGHKRTTLEPFLAKLTLLFTSYAHFQIEHVHGHHWNVATPNDPATARKGQSFYNFWKQSVVGSYMSAWNIEFKRLAKLGKSAYHPYHNAMIGYTVGPIVVALALVVAFGSAAGLFFFAQSFIGFSLLEVINYVEHYGLERIKLANGQWERVRPIHSWNANMRITNYFLFKLQRHSDHHAYPYRRYQILRSFDESPNLPTGYAGMSLLALVPPLWFAIMDPLVDAHVAQVESLRKTLNEEDMAKHS